MIEIKTIASDKYEPSEDHIHLKHVGMITGREAFQLLETHLEKVGLMPDEYFLLSWDPCIDNELPDFSVAICSTNWGSSEGIYLDISLQYSENRERKYLHFATGKTLDSSGDAFLKMSRIAAECSMMLNGRGDIVRVSEQAYDKPFWEDTQKSSIQVIDAFTQDNDSAYYHVTLAPGHFVDVKVSYENNLVYVMQNEDGSTVFGEQAGVACTYPDYQYDEAAVIALVKETHQLGIGVSKSSLSERIESAEKRCSPVSGVPVKENECNLSNDKI